jgi:hypothetical protein
MPVMYVVEVVTPPKVSIGFFLRKFQTHIGMAELPLLAVVRRTRLLRLRLLATAVGQTTTIVPVQTPPAHHCRWCRNAQAPQMCCTVTAGIIVGV